MSILNFTYEDICILKSRDERLAKVINAIGELDRKGSDDIFSAIIESIVSQQLSGRVADVIYNRLQNLLSEVTPENIFKKTAEEIKSVGLSMRKAIYIKSIADAVINKEVDIENFVNMSDEEVINELVKFHGIGEWTAEMLLIFCLKRPDILSYKDLGIKKGLEYLYFDRKIDFKEIKKKFSPYCSLLSFYLWEISARGPQYVKNLISEERD